jgi:hypothetical protein
VRLSEEDFAVRREEHLLVQIVGDAHRDHVRIGNTSLLRVDSLEPDPDELFSVDEETKVLRILGRAVVTEVAIWLAKSPEAQQTAGA